ncbi:MAG: hypothetical protein ABIH83_00915 [Candidatus Micrarchaeota archaeon]
MACGGCGKKDELKVGAGMRGMREEKMRMGEDGELVLIWLMYA